MTIFIDENEIEVFSGAVISDILHLYSEKEYENVNNGKTNIYDAFDNIVSLDGAVTSGSKYFVREK